MEWADVREAADSEVSGGEWVASLLNKNKHG